MKQSTEARSDRPISADHLNRNLYKFMKWRSSLSSDTGSTCSDSRKVVNKSSTNISTSHSDQALAPQELSEHWRIEALVAEEEGASLNERAAAVP